MGRLTTRQLASKRGRQGKSAQRTGLQPGDMLQDRYRIVGTLGVGGFSSVYQARDMRFPNATKLCAIKEMVIAAPDPQMRELTIKSFEREASMLAMLDHPAIPDISDYFTEKDRSYLVQELIRGRDLEHWLEEQTEPLKQELALEWLIQLCDVLGYLHSQKPQPIVFRDLKPSNIMLDQHNHIRLIDFGIAKAFDMGNKGTMIGTEGYSPPEQYRGQATPAGDIYALGATFHHLLTRQDPRLEPPFTFAERPIHTVNPTVAAAFEAILMRCLSYDPKERFPHALALKEAVQLISQPTAGMPEVAAMSVTAVSPHLATISPTTNTTNNTIAPPVAVVPPVIVVPAQIKPLWTFKCEDEIRSKPAASNNLVFVGAYDNNLYAINTESGEFQWKFPTSDGVGSSPYVHEDSVLIGSADKHLYCVQARYGRLNWRFATTGPIYSSPSVKFGHAFIGSDDGFLYAVNMGHGRLAWKSNAMSEIRSSPYVTEDRVFFGTDGGFIFSLEVSTGKNKWQSTAKRAVISSPTVAEDIVVVGSMDSTVYALDAATGWKIWQFRSRRPIVSSPVVHNGVVYIGSSDGNLYAIDLGNGRQLWTFETKGQVASSPAIWSEAVYFGSSDGAVYSLHVKRGELRWRFDTGSPVISSPTIDNGVVYIGSTNHQLYALPV